MRMVLENIKRLCEQNGVSIYALEKATGIGNGVIGKWEKHNPRIDQLKRVADYFGCTVDTLLKEVS